MDFLLTLPRPKSNRAKMDVVGDSANVLKNSQARKEKKGKEWRLKQVCLLKIDKALAGLSEIRGFGGLEQHPCN